MPKSPKPASFANMKALPLDTSWEDIEKLRAPHIINTNTLHRILLSEEIWKWTSLAQDTDPLFPLIEKAMKDDDLGNNEDVLLGISLNNTTLVWLLDPEDGYRSSSSRAVVIPNTRLRTSLPDIFISFDISKHSDVEQNPDKENPFLVKGVACLDGTMVFEVGTIIYDSYYPSATSYFETKEIDRVARLSTKKLLTKETKNALSKKPLPSKRKL